MPAVGRGGAGNIQILEQERARSASDLEANASQGDAPADASTTRRESHSKSVQPLNSPRKEQQYAHSGRGGAGNYYSPKELKQTGNFHGAADTSHVPGSGTPAPEPPEDWLMAETARTYGRGGAGNYLDPGPRVAAEKAKEEKRAQQKLSAEVEQGVNESLAAPPKARLPREG